MFKPGDQVDFLNEEGGGTVTKVEGNTVTVEDENGFDYDYPPSLLVKRGGQDYQISDRQVEEELNKEKRTEKDKRFYQKFQHLEKLRKSDEMEVDLHIEVLIGSHKGMDNYQIVQVQLAQFRRSMNKAIAQKMRKVIFIHGVGAGVLRQEIRKELYAYFPEYEFMDGSYERYGAGATEVLLRG